MKYKEHPDCRCSEDCTFYKECTERKFRMNIDRKYIISALNPASKAVHTAEDSVLFLAKDKAFLAVLPVYLEKCAEMGATEDHLKSVALLIQRVEQYQRDVESKVPDTNRPGEIERCIHGVL